MLTDPSPTRSGSELGPQALRHFVATPLRLEKRDKGRLTLLHLVRKLGCASLHIFSKVFTAGNTDSDSPPSHLSVRLSSRHAFRALAMIQKKDLCEEDPADYNEGGYLPVNVGDSLNRGQYVVLRKLGWGHFSTVWLVKDTVRHRHTAVKIVKSAPHYNQTALDEIVLLDHVAQVNPSHPGHRYMVSLLDTFSHPSLSRKLEHQCMVFEPSGPNLLSLLALHKEEGTLTKGAGGLPTELVKVIAKQVLLGLQYLHEECKLIHTDIKPENILVTIPDVENVCHAELTASPSTPYRTVGIPNRRRASVHIFDSQPLPSPRFSSSATPSLYNSTSPIDRLTLRMSAIHTSSVSTSLVTTTTDPTSVSVVSNNSLNQHYEEENIGKRVPLDDRKPRVSLISQTAPRPRKKFELDLEEEQDGDEEGGWTSSDSSSSRDPRSLARWIAPSHVPPPLRQEKPVEFPTFSIKIADLGNATPIIKHFTDDIQTRQYRAPEAILGKEDWGPAVDIWSVACVVFEMLTSDYLWDPKGSPNGAFSRDDDHIAQIMELLGDMDRDVKFGGRKSREIFNSKGLMRYIKVLRYWPLHSVLQEKYLYTESEATEIRDFLLPMLALDPRKRKTASEMINHPWLDA